MGFQEGWGFIVEGVWFDSGGPSLAGVRSGGRVVTGVIFI